MQSDYDVLLKESQATSFDLQKATIDNNLREENMMEKFRLLLNHKKRKIKYLMQEMSKFSSESKESLMEIEKSSAPSIAQENVSVTVLAVPKLSKRQRK